MKILVFMQGGRGFPVEWVSTGSSLRRSQAMLNKLLESYLRRLIKHGALILADPDGQSRCFVIIQKRVWPDCNSTEARSPSTDKDDIDELNGASTGHSGPTDDRERSVKLSVMELP